MALVMLPGLSALIEDISEEKKLPANVVEAALREALLKGYERYRRTLYIGISEDPFDEEYFSNFDVGLDLDEEGYRVLASKIIVEEVESEDHQIGLVDVQQVTDDAQLGDTVVLDVTPEKDDFGRMAAATTKQVLAQKLREHQRRMIQEEFADLEDPVLTARVIRFERQSVIMAVSSGLGRPEVEAELPRRDQLPNDNYRANATFKVFLKEVSEIARRGPQLFISRANAAPQQNLRRVNRPADRITSLLARTVTLLSPLIKVTPTAFLPSNSTRSTVTSVSVCRFLRPSAGCR